MSMKDLEHKFHTDSQNVLKRGCTADEADIELCPCGSGKSFAKCHGAPCDCGSGKPRFKCCGSDEI